jgi:hypothetical protein
LGSEGREEWVEATAAVGTIRPQAPAGRAVVVLSAAVRGAVRGRAEVAVREAAERAGWRRGRKSWRIAR